MYNHEIVGQLDYVIVRIGDKILSTDETGEKIGKIIKSDLARKEQEGIWFEGNFTETNKHKKLPKNIPFHIDIYYKKDKRK